MVATSLQPNDEDIIAWGSDEEEGFFPDKIYVPWWNTDGEGLAFP